MNGLIVIIALILSLVLVSKLLTGVFQWLSRTLGQLADVFPRLIILVTIITLLWLILSKDVLKGFKQEFTEPTQVEPTKERWNYQKQGV